ncbi:hypothetical protein [Fulvivirga sedimenti]|uniref:Neurotransmitter-gated ion-channel ligand-binding domain-containing protein n=1 Tax=Fulvivirga sedimenti TaxID=2879465 RepID=A0A9X1L171_9BACT|nr:hypothetical protein [Fulvivirga sedimenti]MCA6075444.1 hypothetical protein [Fulvivirga sedimenti]MCA6076621.1 hypothetical protein [Fulvivirga sedimenti]MCA6077749.1 hypothetical protein [Fulvivirga sedimenti]
MSDIKTIVLPLILLLLCFSGICLAQNPGTPGQKEEVKVGFVLLDLFNIDNVKGTVSGEFVFTLSWTDTSLVRPGQTAPIILPYDSVNPPQIQIRNVIDYRSFRERSVTVLPNGEVNSRHRLTGILNTKFNFRKFPFDRQTLGISIFDTSVEQDVRLIPDDRYQGIFKPDSLSIPNWKVMYNGMRTYSDVEYGIPFQSIVFSYSLVRISEFYIWKVVFPMVLVVLMSWSVFWIDPKNISAQLTVSVTAILTLIVFQFSVAQTLPELPYLTSLDKYVIGTDIFVFMAFLETLITSYHEDRGKKELSALIDRTSRILFPAVFVLFILLTLIIF